MAGNLRRFAGMVCFRLSCSFLRLLGYFCSINVRELEPDQYEKVLVLSPHADDETIGCSCIISKHLAKGAVVTLVSITDGARSQGDLRGEGLKEARKHELLEVCRRIGIEDIEILGLPDGSLKVDDYSAGLLENILYTRRPDVVYLPFFCDAHRDHVAVSRLFAAAVPRSELNCEVRAYEVQTPITPLLFNAYCEITGCQLYKCELFSIYKTQCIDFEGIEEKYRVNAHFIKGAGSAEVFISMGSLDYCLLVNGLVKDTDEWAGNFSAAAGARILKGYLRGLRYKWKIGRMIKEGKRTVVCTRY